MAASLKANLAMGIAAGLVGTALMGAYQAAAKKAAPKPQSGSGEEPATDRLAARVMKKAGTRNPSKKSRQMGGQVVHWGYGATWGAVAGLARASGMRLDWGGGQALGAGLWALGDLWLVYRMGLAKHPREYPPGVHLNALGAHLAYGLGVWSAFAAAERMHRRAHRSELRHAA